MATNSATLLADYGKPTINGVRAELILTNELLENIFQGQIESNGKGITQKFTMGNMDGAQIAVMRVKPIYQEARELGASINGGNYPQSPVQSETEVVGIDVLTVIDTPIDILRATTDLIRVDLLKAHIDNFSTNQVNLNLNAITMAGKLFKTLKAGADGEEVNITTVDLSSATLDLAYDIMTANSLLDEGDLAHDVSMFPENDRIIVVQSGLRPILLKKGILVVGGANYAYDIQKSGALDAQSKPSKISNGFIGHFDGVDVHIATPLVRKVAGQYLGFDQSVVDECLGYVSSAFANSRGVNMSEAVKVIPCPVAQGVRLLPFVRMGFASWYAKGNSLLMKSGYVNPYTFLNGCADYDSIDLDLNNRAPGSRVKPTIEFSGVVAGTGFTATFTNATKGRYLISATDIKDIATFMRTYGTTYSANVVSSGSAVSEATATAGKYIVVLAYAVDGSCVLKSQKVPA